MASTAAVVAFACSSSSSPPAAGQSSDDAAAADTGTSSGTSSSGGGSSGSGSDGQGAPADAAVMMMSNPCDAGAAFPGDGGVGYACGACLKMNCAPQLTECQQSSCLCVASVECLVTHDNNYTLCMDTAMVAIFGDQGLIDAAACLTSKCLAICDGADH